MTDATIKKGLRNPLDEAQVRRAVLALQSFVAKQQQERAKQPLVETAPSVQCIITRKLVPAKAAVKPIPIDLPHAIHDETAEICLFVKDDDKKRIKEALEKDPVPGLAKVMTVKKLRKNFSRFEDKRALAGAYDMFLADDRIVTYLKAPLGNTFFVKKKQPIAVRVSRNSVSASLKRATNRTAFHVNAGVCNNVKVARLDMTPQEIVDNIMVGMNRCAAVVPKGWNGVQSISVKTDDSLALPIYNALAPLAKLPAVGKTHNLKKRKLEEFVADHDEQEQEKAKGKKKGKKETKVEEVKKQQKKKAETPKEQPKKTSKAAKTEEETPKKSKKAKKVVETSEEAPKKKAKKVVEASKETPTKAKKAKKAEEKTPEKATPPAKKQKTRGKKKVASKNSSPSEFAPMELEAKSLFALSGS
ncbi:Ribosomal L1 domain-containing protein 1 [Phytophthora boehmeriae]|uniref:Ribosomal L1 domain-containing protein 1 n=1 Tax=Phytophthora boehmeriae TaxID=109152 RepID=A0A8T1WVJ4_9STRA|nr:Ribosomal L1 domain-containing protein 1 [Phytophthora boehmeriae]